jgi:hypothetical protein
VKYTDEQLDAAQAFSERKPLKVKAFAGSGKTTVLRLMANRDGRLGLYLSYNRQIAESSRNTFPRRVACMTAHALALSCLPKELQGKFAHTNALQTPLLERVLRSQVALPISLARQYSPLVQATLHWYCVSSDPYPALHHVERAMRDIYVEADPVDVLAVMPALWDAIVTPTGPLPITFDAQLKLLQLAERPLPFDYVLADEVQDTYPAIEMIIRNSGAQVAWVGDPSQQIYDFNGAENAMARLSDLESYTLTQSFRFGEWLAELVQPLLRQLGDRDIIRGNPEIHTHRSKRRMPVLLARSNASLLVPLVNARKANKSVCVLGGVDKLAALLDSAERVMRNQREETGLFAGLNSWREARDKAAQRGNRALREVVKLIEEHKLRAVRGYVESARYTGPDASLTLSTVHQAKGLEFERVGLLDDFRPNEEFLLRFRGKDIFAPAPEALRHLYVALTRAKYELNVPMSLARRFGIDNELNSQGIRGQAPSTRTEEVPIEIPATPVERRPENKAHPAYSAPVSHTVLTPKAAENPGSVTNSFWERWGTRVIIAAGVLANVLLADHKGFIDLSALLLSVGF